MKAQGPVGTCGVELLQRGVPALGELRRVVVARINPSPVGGRIRPVRHKAEEGVHVAGLPKRQLQEGHGVGGEVSVRVDEPGHQGPASEVADLGVWMERPQFVGFPDRGYPPVLHEDGLRLRLVHRQDVSAKEDRAHEPSWGCAMLYLASSLPDHSEQRGVAQVPVQDVGGLADQVRLLLIQSGRVGHPDVRA